MSSSVKFFSAAPSPLTRGLFSPKNAPNPFAGLALRSPRLPSWLQGVGPRKGKRREGDEGKKVGMDSSGFQGPCAEYLYGPHDRHHTSDAVVQQE